MVEIQPAEASAASLGESNQEHPERFREASFLVVQHILTDPLLDVVYQYALKRARYSRESEDAQVPSAAAFYADPLMETLLELTLPTVNRLSGADLLPTYSYLRVYPQGTLLNPHTDREACEITLSINLGGAGQQPWPLFLATNQGIQRLLLGRGDGVMFRGQNCPHWRGELRNEHAAQAFLHFVDANGPAAGWRFDRRPAIGYRAAPIPKG